MSNGWMALCGESTPATKYSRNFLLSFSLAVHTTPLRMQFRKGHTSERSSVPTCAVLKLEHRHYLYKVRVNWLPIITSFGPTTTPCPVNSVDQSDVLCTRWGGFTPRELTDGKRVAKRKVENFNEQSQNLIMSIGFVSAPTRCNSITRG